MDQLLAERLVLLADAPQLLALVRVNSSNLAGSVDRHSLNFRAGAFQLNLRCQYIARLAGQQKTRGHVKIFNGIQQYWKQMVYLKIRRQFALAVSS